MFSNLFSLDKKTIVINFLVSFIVFSFIIGNLVLNLNVILLIIISFIFYNKKIINQNYNKIDKLVFILFLYIVLSGFYNNIYFLVIGETNSFDIIIKSILYLRFFLLYIVLKFLVEEKIINLKNFFFFSLLAVLFVSLDIIFQLVNGYDIFGYKAVSRRLSGPFGDELIAGSFLQRFALFALFFTPIFLKFNKQNSTVLLTFFLFSIIGNPV
jgi:hypothetical protein